MKRSHKVVEATWAIDPDGQWATKTERLGDAAGTRTILYRPDAAGTVATWWDTRIVTTHRFELDRGFEMASVQVETLPEPFDTILATARAASAEEGGATSSERPTRRWLLGY